MPLMTRPLASRSRFASRTVAARAPVVAAPARSVLAKYAVTLVTPDGEQVGSGAPDTPL